MKEKKLVKAPKAKELAKPVQAPETRNLGMSGVDPSDIRPPLVKLINKMTDTSAMENADGKAPKYGQYWNSATGEIYDSFEAYFIFANKADFEDMQKNPAKMYQMIGVLADNMMIFGMTFRKGAMWALTPLFTAARAQKRGMYSIRVKLESKKVNNDLGEWATPILKVLGPEKDEKKLKELEALARQYDIIGHQAMKQVQESEEAGSQTTEDGEQPLQSKDIPF